MRLGSHLTIEQKAKDSASLMGRVVSAETRAKISAAHKGKPGHPMPDSTRQALSKANTGLHPGVETRAKIGLGHRGISFSIEHRIALSANHRDVRGELNPAWRGGIAPELMLIRTSDVYSSWRTAVFTRDAFTCQKCNNEGGILRVHHMDSFADIPERRMDIDNGITLCNNCHKEFHHIYGVRHNRQWQTDEFLSEALS